MSWKANAAFLATMCLATTHAVADNEPPSVIFNPKVFFDSADIVHVEGTLTGEGIGNQNNRSVITCYRVRRECLALHIEAEGFQVSSIGVPTSFKVDFWGSDRIVADLALRCGNHLYTKLDQDWQTMASATWVIDRPQQTATLIDHSCVEATAQRWTLEDPQYWRDAKVRAAEHKPEP